MKKKHALLTSGLCLGLSAALLTGATFAWFTDSVTNKGNTIQAGNLDVELWYRDLEAASGGFNIVPATAEETGQLFTSDNWEPGRSQGVDLKVTNEGSLALQWELVFTNLAIEGNANIADVLDVYVIGAAQGAEALNEKDPVGTLADLATGTVKTGYLEAEGQDPFSVVLKMQETAGSEYQNCTVTFDVVLRATQYTEEEDGFGSDQYDANATYGEQGSVINEDAILSVLGDLADEYTAPDADKAEILKDAGIVTNTGYYANRVIEGLDLGKGLVLDQGSSGGINLTAFVANAATVELQQKDGVAQNISISEGKYLTFDTIINSGVSTYTLTFKDADKNVVSEFDAKFYGVAFGGLSKNHTVTQGVPTNIVIGSDNDGQRIDNFAEISKFADIQVVSNDPTKLTVNSYSFDENGNLTVNVTTNSTESVHLRYLMTFANSDVELSKTFCKVQGKA